MLKPYKHIQPFVLTLLLSAWVFQVAVPALTLMQKHLHTETAAFCDLSDPASSCAVDGQKNCMCTHHAPSADDNATTTLCNCTHHGGQPMGMAPASQIKGVLLSTTGLSMKICASIQFQTVKTIIPLFTREIFHPPRLIA